MVLKKEETLATRDVNRWIQKDNVSKLALKCIHGHHSALWVFWCFISSKDSSKQPCVLGLKMLRLNSALHLNVELFDVVNNL